MIEIVNQENQLVLLQLARKALEYFVRESQLLKIDSKTLDEALKQQGASFVTLHINEQLRGCIGTLVAHQPIYQDVLEHAIAAGTRDFRFPAVQEEELTSLHYEISLLSHPQPISYKNSQDLLNQLQVGEHGVVLSSGKQRATFLPQVWQSLPNKEEFLGHLCLKMGVAADAWRKQHYEVSIYQVQEFAE
ncbi:MAG: AmmeMemoRadiSam system protein A [Anaerolineaceae bacterium]|nr:AmmeMemoRadiSam system protein A [Anaerolineaceae bacterium]